MATLTQQQIQALAQKLEAFRDGLSEPEQKFLDKIVMLAASQSDEVQGHATLAEYGLLLALIAVITLPGYQTQSTPPQPPPLTR